MAKRDIMVRIGGDASGIKKAADESIGAMNRISTGAAKVVTALGAIGAVEVFRRMTMQGLEFADSQAKLARRLDSTIDSVRAVQLAAGRAGLELEAASDIMDRFNRVTGEAVSGNEAAAEGFARLNINIQDFAKMQADERIALVADRVAELGLSGSETASIMKDFGIKNQEAMEILRGGGEVIRRARQEVDEFGLSLSEVDAAMIERANDAMEDMKLVVESLSTKFAVALSPVLVTIAENFNEIQKEGNEFKNDFDKVVEALVFGAGAAANSVQAIAVSLVGVAAAAVGAFTIAAKAANALDTELGEMAGLSGRWTKNLSQETRDLITLMVPGIGGAIGVMEGLGDSADGATNQFAELDKMFNDLMAKFNQTGGFFGTGQEWVDAIRKMREEMLADSGRGDEERELAQHIKNLDTLKAKFMSGEIKTVEEFHTQLESLEVAHKKRMANIRAGEGGESGGLGGDPDPAKLLEVQKQLASIRDSVRTDEERELIRHLENLDALKAGWESGQFKDVQEFHALLQGLEVAHNERMAELQANSPEGKYRQQLADNLAALQEFVMSEEEIEQERFAVQMERLAEIQSANIDATTDYHTLREELETAHFDRMNQIRENAMTDEERFQALSLDRKLAGLANHMDAMLSVSAGASKEMFALAKAAAIANAILHARESIVSSYKYGADIGGPPLGAVMAGVAAAAQFAQIAQIKAATFSGSGSSSASSSGAAGGGSVSQAAPGSGGSQSTAPASPQTVQIQVRGAVFDRATVLSLIDELNDAVADGARIQVV